MEIGCCLVEGGCIVSMGVGYVDSTNQLMN